MPSPKALPTTGGRANPTPFSDQGPQNENLGNRDNALARRSPRAPTSGMQSLGFEPDDYFRQPVPPVGPYSTLPADTITPARVTLSVRMRFNAIKGLDPRRLIDYLDQWHLGFFRMAGWTWLQMMRRDYQLRIDPPKRFKAVARHGYEILQKENVAAADISAAEEQVEFLKEFYDGIQATNAIKPDEVGGMALLIRQMMEAQAYYYAVHNIVWQPTADGKLTCKMIYIPVYWLEGTRGKLRYLQSEFQVYGVDMDPGDWLVTCGEGLMEACSVIYLFKHLPLKSWLTLLDRLGGGGLMAKTPATYGSQEWNGMVDTLRDFAEDWTAVFSQNTEVSLLEAKNVVGEGPFAAIIEKMDRAITQMWRGGDLSTSSKKDGVGANLQQDESEIFETDDATLLEETLDLQLTKFALQWKFGPDVVQLAQLKLRTTPQQNVTQDLAVDTFLMPLGLLAQKATLARYNRPIPEAGEAMIVPPAPPAMPGAGPGGRSSATPKKKTSFGNASADVNLDKRLIDASVEPLADAWRKDFKQLGERLRGIVDLEDPPAARIAIEKLKHDLDNPGSALIRGILEKPETAQALARSMTAGFFNGIAATIEQTHTVDGKPAFENDHWVTIDGNHILLKGPDVTSERPTQQQIPLSDAFTERHGAADVEIEGNLPRPIKAGLITTRPDLMQFKHMDDTKAGVNNEDKLDGKWDTLKAGNLLLWQPNDPSEYGLSAAQKYIVANGHHRFELGQGQDVKLYSAQIVKESEGYSASDARALGAEINIAGNKGTIYDQAKFLRNDATTHGQDAAVARAGRIGAKGRQAAAIAFTASPDTFHAFVNERITPEHAEIIGRSAPYNLTKGEGDAENSARAALQRVGIKRAVAGDSPAQAGNVMQAVRTETASGTREQFDMFGSNDAALNRAQKMAEHASRIQSNISAQIRATESAARNAATARGQGIAFVRPPEEIIAENTRLKSERKRWENWSQHPDLVGRVRQANADDDASAPVAAFGNEFNPEQQRDLFGKWTSGDLELQPHKGADYQKTQELFGERVPRAHAKLPHLGAMQKQGDLLGGLPSEDFALAGQKATDYEAVQKARRATAADRGESEKHQTILGDTVALHTSTAGVWLPERSALHDRLVGQVRAGVPSVEHPEFVMLGGGPASGKSTVIKAGAIPLPDTHVLVNADDFKEKLPEYKTMLAAHDTRGAAFVHEESSHLAKRTLRESLGAKQNTVLDGTGNASLAGVEAKAAQAHAAGYKVRAEYATCSVETALARSAQRAAATGRVVPEAMLRDTHRNMSNIFPAAVSKGVFDEARLWDTEGAAPVLVASAKGKELTIHSQSHWDKFLAKGKA